VPVRHSSEKGCVTNFPEHSAIKSASVSGTSKLCANCSMPPFLSSARINKARFKLDDTRVFYGRSNDSPAIARLLPSELKSLSKRSNLWNEEFGEPCHTNIFSTNQYKNQDETRQTQAEKSQMLPRNLEKYKSRIVLLQS